MSVVALVLLAVALLLPTSRSGVHRLRRPVGPGAPVEVLRPLWIAVAAVAGAVLGGLVAGPVGTVVTAGLGLAATLAIRARLGRPRPTGTDAAALAAAWELLDVCLRAGLPVASALAAAAASLDGDAGTALRRVAGLLQLGAPAPEAWAGTGGLPALAVLGRAASRSAGTGAALAQVAAAECARLRAELVDTAQARAQRAGVLVAGPLGLCFLPAFLVLGIAPVVIGLAGEALARW